MNHTNTTVAYFIVTEPRLGTEEYNYMRAQALQNGLEVYGVFGEGKLYILYHRR